MHKDIEKVVDKYRDRLKTRIEKQAEANKADTMPFIEKPRDNRTLKQNGTMHQYFKMLAIALNDAGLDMKKVLKPSVDIPWTKESVKEHLWRPVQEAMLIVESTADLKTKGPGDIYEVINRHLSEKFSVHVPWPCKQTQQDEANGYAIKKPRG